jgi:small subunit ribosomal protein S9
MATKSENRYIEAVGRRKTATARVRLTPSSKMSYTINGKPLAEYFYTPGMQKTIQDVFTKSKIEDKFDITAQVSGSGMNAQVEAVRHGISRVLVKIDEETNKSVLKKLGYLKRDPRSKERRKAGMAGKARKGKQWSKR